jgi:hypothetical protein
MKKSNSAIIIFIFLVMLIISCGGLSLGNAGIEGQWVEKKQSCGLYPLRGFPKVEFLKDKTAITYNIINGKESSGLVGEYTLLDDDRIKIEWAKGRFTDILEYSISDDTLTLCNGDRCCDYQPENQGGAKHEDDSVQQSPSQNQIIGVWRSKVKDSTNEYQFLEDGSFQWTSITNYGDQIIFRGNYNLKGSELIYEITKIEPPFMELPKGKQTSELEISTDKLIFIREAGEREEALRVR